MYRRLYEGIVFDFAILLESDKFLFNIECCEHSTSAVILVRQILQPPSSDHEYKGLVRKKPDD